MKLTLEGTAEEIREFLAPRTNCTVSGNPTPVKVTYNTPTEKEYLNP